jgi:hypothetical protein
MFAPLVAKPKAKAAASSSNVSALHRARPVGQRHGDVGQAHMSRPLPQSGPGLFMTADSNPEQGADPASMSARGGPPGPSWNFSKIPVFSPGCEERFEMPLLFPAPRLPGLIQAKPKVAAEGRFEHETDRVPDQVTGMPEASSTNMAASRFDHDVPGIVIHPAAEQAARTKPASKNLASRLGHKAEHNGRGGETLGTLCALMESAFGADFSGVRIHRDSRADDLYARAVTRGEDIHLGRGEDPGTPSGRELVAHELAHVVQQRNAPALSGDERVVDDPALERRADVAAQAAARGSRAPDPGKTPARAIVQRQPKKMPPPTGGNILYVGMNNFAPEIATLRGLYRGTGVAVTAVTLTQEEKKTKTAATGSTKFDLTTDAGIDDFANALSLDASKTKVVADLLKGADAFDRDDMAHVIAIYAMTEADGKDRMSRVVLSGHSRGKEVFAKGDKGDIYFTFLVALAGVFPNAAGQTKHLMGAACFAGDEDTIVNLYQPAFPNLVTFSGWTFFSPSGSEGVSKIRDWAKTTDVNPNTLPAPAVGEATWESGTYHGANPQQSAADTMSSLRFHETLTFDDYFNGDKVDTSPYKGDLVDYYIKANSAANRTRTITGADHDYAKLHADQAFRLRFWKPQVAKFWQTYRVQIQKGYGASTAPNYGNMSRKDALNAIANFGKVAKGLATDQANAQKLLDALKSLDPTIMKDSWI